MLLYKETDVIFFFPAMPLLVFPCGSAGKESACKVGDLALIPGLARSSGERKGYPLQYSGLENSMGHIVHGVTKSHTLVRPLDMSHLKYLSRNIICLHILQRPIDIY